MLFRYPRLFSLKRQNVANQGEPVMSSGACTAAKALCCIEFLVVAAVVPNIALANASNQDATIFRCIADSKEQIALYLRPARLRGGQHSDFVLEVSGNYGHHDYELGKPLVVGNGFSQAEPYSATWHVRANLTVILSDGTDFQPNLQRISVIQIDSGSSKVSYRCKPDSVETKDILDSRYADANRGKALPINLHNLAEFGLATEY